MQTKETLIYLEDFTDEVMPCFPRLEEWAEWLSQPDPEWNRTEAAKDGEVFKAHSLVVLGDVRVEWIDGAWSAVERIPAETDQFFLRPFEGCEGWDPQFSGDDLQNALDGLEADESPVWVACVKSGPSDLRVRFDAAGPTCVLITEGAH